ncbi:MAG TPA: trypsin-like peptidase domain-containing protein [Acidimicrobiales bacterium]|nr:trypsin-like peptidase domain-containing protein [Acidimicrobiales bacterium]
MSDQDSNNGGWGPVPGQGLWYPQSVREPDPMGSGPAAPPPPAPEPKRRRRAMPLMLTAALVVAGGAAGVAVGHDMWTTSSASPAAASSTPSSNSSGSSGSGSSLPSGSGNGSSSGTDPFSGGLGNIFGNGSSGGSGGYSGSDPGSYFGGSSGDNGGSGSSGTGATSAQAAAVAAKVDPALVDINSTFSYQQASGAGTGIVLTSNGLVLTNNHVIDGATKLSVTDVGNGKTYNATVLGYDASHDVALVKLQGASGLKTADLGDSSSAAVGQSVVAIGNAGGTGGTPSNAGGAITALNQSITASDDLDGNSEQLSGLIQTNAGIQPGDSGGSLVNMSGQVIGMDTAASEGTSFSSSSGGSTQGYAIPIDEALSIVHQIESGTGTSTTHVGATAMLGLLFDNSSSSQGSSGSFGFGSGGSGGSDSSGATISSVVNGGPAASAGLAAGDTITSLAGQSVNSPSDLSSILVGYHPGDKVQVGWVDSSGQSHTTTVDLGSGPPA